MISDSELNFRRQKRFVFLLIFSLMEEVKVGLTFETWLSLYELSLRVLEGIHYIIHYGNLGGGVCFAFLFNVIHFFLL